MFETAELGQSIAPKKFRKFSTIVREQLLELQEQLRKEKCFQVILVFAGVDGAGKSEAVALLNQWMDARWLTTCAYDELTTSERERPEFWRYWRDLPPRGRIGMFLSAWYSQPVLDRVYRNIDEATFIKHIERIAAFENALVDDGALIMKFWMHLSKDAQEIRLKSLEDDPLTSARVSERDWEHWKIYENFIEAAEQVIARTNRGKAAWTIVEGVDSKLPEFDGNINATRCPATQVRGTRGSELANGDGPEQREIEKKQEENRAVGYRKVRRQKAND